MKETIKENHFSVSLAILSERNLKFTRVTSKNINKTTGHLDKLSAETVDLTVNLEFTHTQKKHWRGTIPGRKSNKKLKNRSQSHRRWSVKCRSNISKINWIRGQISRNNLPIDDIKEASEKKSKYIADKLGIESDVEIDRCHRAGSCKTKAGQNLDRSLTVVSRLNKFKDKQRILNNAKNSEKNGHLY